jgi:glycosyltransferase involved in cell wall biosynthesis
MGHAEHRVKLDEPVSVLMPVCNEADVIESVLDEWDTAVMSHCPEGSELLLDDGDSKDGTLEILRSREKRYPYLRVLRSKREGFAAAARRLYQEAACPLVFFTDSDGQYVADDFWRIAAATGRADVVHGYKAARKDSLVRVGASYCFNALARRAFGLPYHDINSAFRLMSRRAVMDVLPEMGSLRTLFNAELFLRMVARGLTVEEIGVRHRPRTSGTSRGLPPRRFLAECCQAFRGLGALRREFAQRTTSAAMAEAPRETVAASAQDF